VPSGGQWSNVDEQVAGALSVGGGGDSGVEDSDYGARRHRATSPHHDETETDNDMQLNDSQLLRAWRILNAQQLLGMTGLLLDVSVLAKWQNATASSHLRCQSANLSSPGNHPTRNPCKQHAKPRDAKLISFRIHHLPLEQPAPSHLIWNGSCHITAIIGMSEKNQNDIWT